VPLRPDFADHVPDLRVVRYDNRVARLRRDGTLAGHVLVQTQAWAEVVAGHLWWRRWGPARDALDLWTVVDGRFDDAYVTTTETIGAIEMWDRGEFEHHDEILAADWLSAEDSVTESAAVFD